MLGRPSAAEIVQVTNFVGPMYGLSEVITWTCGGVRMNSRSAVLSFQTDKVQPHDHRYVRCSALSTPDNFTIFEGTEDVGGQDTSTRIAETSGCHTSSWGPGHRGPRFIPICGARATMSPRS